MKYINKETIFSEPKLRVGLDCQDTLLSTQIITVLGHPGTGTNVSARLFPDHSFFPLSYAATQTSWITLGKTLSHLEPQF